MYPWTHAIQTCIVQGSTVVCSKAAELQGKAETLSLLYVLTVQFCSLFILNNLC